MKTFIMLPLLLATTLLAGCPDAKIPKGPPSVPEPKAVLLAPGIPDHTA